MKSRVQGSSLRISTRYPKIYSSLKKAELYSSWNLGVKTCPSSNVWPRSSPTWKGIWVKYAADESHLSWKLGLKKYFHPKRWIVFLWVEKLEFDSKDLNLSHIWVSTWHVKMTEFGVKIWAEKARCIWVKMRHLSWRVESDLSVKAKYEFEPDLSWKLQMKECFLFRSNPNWV